MYPPQSPTRITNNSILKFAGAFHCVNTSRIRFWAFSYSVGEPCGRSDQVSMYFIDAFRLFRLNAMELLTRLHLLVERCHAYRLNTDSCRQKRPNDLVSAQHRMASDSATRIPTTLTGVRCK